VAEPGTSYRVEGEGKPLLLVHGFGIPFNIWKNLLPLLSAHFKLVMVELPGIGKSPMPPEGQDYMAAAIACLDEARQALGVKRWAVLGYSSGSRVAEAYVQKYAGHVCHALFLCPVTMDVHKARALSFGLQMDRSFPAFGTWVLSGWRLRFLISWLGFNLQRDERSAEWYAEIGVVPVRVLKETIQALMPASAGPFSVPVPYAMIWGDLDLVPQTPRQPGPNDYFVHGRHAAPLEAAHEVAAIIRKLLTEGE
jgi:pimeloyl-ACP methyl ester carboxylesterase